MGSVVFALLLRSGAEELMWKKPEVVCAFVDRWTSKNEKKNPKHTERYKKSFRVTIYCTFQNINKTLGLLPYF